MITLEITSTDIKLMEVTKGKVTKWASGPLEAGMFQDEVVSNPKALGIAVKQLMSSSGMKANKVIASVSGLYSLSRMVLVPGPLDRPVAEQAVLAAVEEVMPLTDEEMYFSWHTVAPGHGGQQVLVVGVPRDVIDSEVRALRTAGINPHVLGLRTLALARAVNRENAIVLNVEMTSYDVVMVVNGIAEVLRTTAWQPEGLSIEERAEVLVSSLNLTVSFYHSHHPGSNLNPATPLFITGPLSSTPDLTEQIRNQGEYTIEALAPSLGYPEHMPVSQYAVNFGLALQATGAPLIHIRFTRKSREAPGDMGNMVSIPDINLLPQAYKGWKPSARQIYASLSIVAAMALFFPISGATTEAIKETSAMRQKYDAVNTVMQRRLAELSKREPFQKAITEYNSLLATGGGFIDDLEAIRNIAGTYNVSLSAISQTTNSLTFNCEADSYNTFRNFIKALEANGRFTVSSVPTEGYPYIKGGAIILTPRPGR